jgi:hypothetical protein
MDPSNSEQQSQESGQKIPNQQIFIIGLLGIVLVIVIVISILILTRPDSPREESPPEPTAIITPSEISPTLTSSPSVTPSPRFTFTPKPTRTPTIAPTPTETPTPTWLPSLTPAFPSEFDDQYILVPWTAELASQLIDHLEVYPESLSSFARGPNNQGYYDAFEFAAFAQQEALLRFPTAPQAQDWSWQLAYNLARMGDPTAGDVYASLITHEIASGNASLNEPIFWGSNGDPKIVVEVIPLEPENGDASSNLIKVRADVNGSSFFWLVEEPSGYISYPLTSEFNFVQPSDIDYFVQRIDSSNVNIVGIFPVKIYDSFNYIFPRIFSLNQMPPAELPFEEFFPPAIGPEFNNFWEPVESGIGDLQFFDVIFPACPVTVTHSYHWNGTSFSFLEATYEMNPDPDLLSYCEIVVDHSAQVWGLETTVQFMELLLPEWPPDSTSEGEEYPEDALDEWRYRLSIYHALLGNQAEAIEYAEMIVSEPASAESPWTAPAIEFLEIYQTQRDIYQACLPSVYCDPKLAFESLVSTLTPEDYQDLIQILEEEGVTVLSNGFFDFDNDGSTERWLVIRHQLGAPLEFWIISSDEIKLTSVFVDNVENTNPRVVYLEPLSEPPTVEIDSDITFHYIKKGLEQEPVIIKVEKEVIFASDLTEMELDHLETILLSGGDPAFVRTELVTLSKLPHFTCSYLLCPRFLYLLGLTSELLNDEFSAVATYLELWRSYPDSPFTIMARFKLGSTITPTPTFTPSPTFTPTATISATSIPTETATVVTPTPGGSPTAITPSPTITETPEGYPPPQDTPTDFPPGYPYP